MAADSAAGNVVLVHGGFVEAFARRRRRSDQGQKHSDHAPLLAELRD
jgi:endonuclease/exonuclease/phosphatase family metal-dependent hydrolase